MTGASDLPVVEWIRLSSEEDLPKKPGLSSYEHVDCLIIHEGETKHRPWNCEHRCWDDEEGDDFYCAALAPTHYAVVKYSEARRLADSDLLCHIPRPETD